MMKTWTMTALWIALAAGCASEPPGTAVAEQAAVAVDFGCAVDLAAEAYTACLRSAYAMRCEGGALGDDLSCLASDHLDDLSDEDILAELGLLCDPLPQPVTGACWSNADFGCPLGLDAMARAACIRAAYVARCAGGAIAGGIWCLGSQHLNDISDDDIAAELGLLEPVPAPAPPGPVPAPAP